MSKSCGIDFGTSNSVLTTLRAGGDVHIVPLEGDAPTLPSALFYEAGGAVHFGRAAQHAFMDGYEGRFMRSLKRILGTSLMDQGTVVNGKRLKFDSILATFVTHMKNQATTELENVVMGRPVHFVDASDEGDRRAQTQLESIAKQAGFKHIAFQYEPIAAAFAHEQNLNDEKLALVVDIGGGTSDFTIIRLSPAAAKKTDRKADILANAGIRLGGNDFDRTLSMQLFMPHFGYGGTYMSLNKELPLPKGPFLDMSEWAKINMLYAPRARAEIMQLFATCTAPDIFGRFVDVLDDEMGHRLLGIVEDSKIALTDQLETIADLGFAQAGLALRIQRPVFNETQQDNVDAIAHAIDSCLAEANVSAGDIELVILTGGMTEMPLLKTNVQKHFPHAAFSDDNKMASVGLGLGYDAARRF